MDPKPWADVISAEDLAGFRADQDPAHRPMTAGSRPAVLVVDMTLAFVDSAYRTGHSPTGWPAVTTNATLLAAARARGLPVFFTDGFADPDHLMRPLERGKWKGTTPAGPPSEPAPFPGDSIVADLAPRADEIVIHKGMRPSAFFGTPLVSYLINARVDTVIVTGMSTSGCVRASVLDAFQYDFHVVVPFDCVADRSQLSHKVSLFDLHMKYADVVSLTETLTYLDSVAPVPA
jgi:nicotinamidase-related amidase